MFNLKFSFKQFKLKKMIQIQGDQSTAYNDFVSGTRKRNILKEEFENLPDKNKITKISLENYLSEKVFFFFFV